MDGRKLRIRWERRAVRELDALPARERERVIAAVETLLDAPLKGEILHADWKGLRRLRVGRYRVVYAFDGATLCILSSGSATGGRSNGSNGRGVTRSLPRSVRKA